MKSAAELSLRFVSEAMRVLEEKHKGGPGVEEALAAVSSATLRANSEAAPPRIDAVCAFLPEGSARLELLSPVLARLLGEIGAQLHWAQAPEVADRPNGLHMSEYAYCQIIGPSGPLLADDIMLGLFIVAPEQFYPDHWHRAPEFYWLFGGPTDWRFSEDEAWETRGPETVLWNPSMQSHAMRTPHGPLVSLWVWTRDIRGEFHIGGSEAGTSLLPS